MVGKMKGSFGSVVDMDLHQNGSYLACVSLDRNLRVFDTNKSNNIIAKIHLK
jgi:WD40 repeat protein